MTRQEITLSEAIRLLNEASQADPLAMRQLVTRRVRCNQQLADHPTIQVRTIRSHHGDRYAVGLLGILNGLFGVDDDGWGAISAVLDKEEPVIRFVETSGKPA